LVTLTGEGKVLKNSRLRGGMVLENSARRGPYLLEIDTDGA
jgi:hypothetical protein